MRQSTTGIACNSSRHFNLLLVGGASWSNLAAALRDKLRLLKYSLVNAPSFEDSYRFLKVFDFFDARRRKCSQQRGFTHRALSDQISDCGCLLGRDRRQLCLTRCFQFFISSPIARPAIAAGQSAYSIFEVVNSVPD